MASNNKFVQEKINELLVTHNKLENKEDFKSPMLRKLHENNDKVRKLRDLFENTEIDISFNNSVTIKDENCTKSLTKRKSESPPTPKFEFTNYLPSFDCLKGFNSSKVSPQKNINKTERIINELVEKEREYIDTLERGIDSYVRLIDNADESFIKIPRQIRHEKFKLFGNIEEIHALHKLIVLPELVSCNHNDVQKLADIFIKLTENETFYPYINYAITYNNSKTMALHYIQFFSVVQKHYDDHLGVFSFLLQPIQKLTRYPLLIEEIIKDLSKNMHENKNTLAMLCIAKKKLEKFLLRLNNSLKLNDIIEAHQLSITLQNGFLSSLQIEFGVDLNKPTFLIVPSFSDFADFQAPFNVFDFGKFIKTESIECHEQKPTYRFFYGELFIFEKYLMYTKKSDSNSGNSNSLLYRNKFKYGPNITIELRQDDRMLTIIEGTREVSFITNTIEKILKLNDLIKKFYDARKSSDSAFFDEHCVAKSSIAAIAENDHNNKNETPKKDKDDDNFSTDSSSDSEYEYDNFKMDPNDDDDEKEEENILEISNSRFFFHFD